MKPLFRYVLLQILRGEIPLEEPVVLSGGFYFSTPNMIHITKMRGVDIRAVKPAMRVVELFGRLIDAQNIAAINFFEMVDYMNEYNQYFGFQELRV